MSAQKTMMGLVYQGNGTLSLQERPVPTILSPKDAVLRVTRSAICTSDLHIKNGAVPRAKEGVILGHEFVGVVTEIGSDVHHLAVGDRVAANCITARLAVLFPKSSCPLPATGPFSETQ